MNKELTKEEAEEYYNKLWLENKEMIQKNIDIINTEVFELRLELIDKNKEIDRLNNLISQREKKWEKWTTEKTILSTKMSDYLCKYQNIKREYTKQIKISTDRKKEIERLNNRIERGLTAIDIVKDIITKQPSSDNLTDLWILSKLEGISNCLKDSDKE